MGEGHFRGHTVDKNPPASAGDMGLIFGLGGFNIPRSFCARAPQLLSLCSGAHEPQLLSPCAAGAESTCPRARTLQLLSPCA